MAAAATTLDDAAAGLAMASEPARATADAAADAERAGAWASCVRAGAEALFFSTAPPLCDNTTAAFLITASAGRAFLLAFTLDPTA